MSVQWDDLTYEEIAERSEEFLLDFDLLKKTYPTLQNAYEVLGILDSICELYELGSSRYNHINYIRSAIIDKIVSIMFIEMGIEPSKNTFEFQRNSR